MEQNILENRDEIKKIFREVIAEYFDEKRNFFKEEILTVMEDVALYNAIKEGEKTDLIDEEEVIKTFVSNN